MRALGKTRIDWVEVDIEEGIRKAGLKCLYPADAWPDLNPVRELATLARKAAKGRGASPEWVPFVFADLKKFLPDLFADHVTTKLEDYAPGKWDKLERKNYRLSLANWLIAFER